MWRVLLTRLFVPKKTHTFQATKSQLNSEDKNWSLYRYKIEQYHCTYRMSIESFLLSNLTCVSCKNIHINRSIAIISGTRFVCSPQEKGSILHIRCPLQKKCQICQRKFQPKNVYENEKKKIKLGHCWYKWPVGAWKDENMKKKKQTKRTERKWSKYAFSYQLNKWPVNAFWAISQCMSWFKTKRI